MTSNRSRTKSERVEMNETEKTETQNGSKKRNPKSRSNGERSKNDKTNSTIIKKNRNNRIIWRNNGRNINKNISLNSIYISNVAFDIHLPKSPDRHVNKSIITIFSGGLAGMIAKTFTAPLERVQMLNQTGATQDTIIKTLDTIFSKNGVMGLWRGNLANCLRVFPHKSILFTTNDIFKSQFSKILHSNSTYLNFLTGAAAGALATTVTYPIDVIRAYLAGTFDKDSKTMYQVSKKIMRKRGFTGLYAGLGVTLIGATPYEACRIGVYNVLRPHIPTVPTNYGNEPHPIGKLFNGACAGAVAGFVTYPTDTVRRMLQVQQANGMTKYNGVWDCIQSNYKRKGIRRFYRGLTAKLVRVIPDAAILFLTYEMLKDYFEDVHYDFTKGKAKHDNE